MQSVDYVLLILSSESSKDQALTWLKKLPESINYFHVLGNPNLNTDFAFDNTNHTLYVKTKDDNISRPRKIIYAMEAIYNTYRFKYILKMDDGYTPIADNFFQVIVDNLSAQIAPHYGGDIKTVNAPNTSQTIIYCTGRFYVLSTDAIASLLPYKTNIARESAEDYAIGLYLHPSYKKNAMLIKSDILLKPF